MGTADMSTVLEQKCIKIHTFYNLRLFTLTVKFTLTSRSRGNVDKCLKMIFTG